MQQQKRRANIKQSKPVSSFKNGPRRIFLSRTKKRSELLWLNRRFDFLSHDTYANYANIKYASWFSKNLKMIHRNVNLLATIVEARLKKHTKQLTCIQALPNLEMPITDCKPDFILTCNYENINNIMLDTENRQGNKRREGKRDKTTFSMKSTYSVRASPTYIKILVYTRRTPIYITTCQLLST